MKPKAYLFEGLTGTNMYSVSLLKARNICQELKWRNIKLIVPAYTNFSYDHLAEAIAAQHDNKYEQIVKQLKGRSYGFGDCGLSILSVPVFKAIYPYESVIIFIHPTKETLAKLKGELIHYSHIIFCVQKVHTDELSDSFADFEVQY